MILFHGTTMSAYENIIKVGIDVKFNIMNELDFGPGFYMSDKQYAKNTAKSKAREALASDSEESKVPVVIILAVDEAAIIRESNGKALIYSRKSLDFLENVFNSRYHKGEDVLDVPYVSAPMADGFVNRVMKSYKEHETPARKAIAYFRYWLPVFHRQRVVKDPDLLKYICIVGKEVV